MDGRSRCSLCGCTLRVLKKGGGQVVEVCEVCKVDPPKKCLVCGTPHRVKDQERCEYCEEEDITRESEYCVMCRGHYKPKESMRYKNVIEGERELLSSSSPAAVSACFEMLKSLQLCDVCVKECSKSYGNKPYDMNHNPPQRRKVLL
jgi:hypothetical protein